MCHVSRLTKTQIAQLRQMPAAYRAKLNDRLEREAWVESTAEAVRPIFEEVYAAWQARETVRATVAVTAGEAYSPPARTALPTFVGGQRIVTTR